GRKCRRNFHSTIQEDKHRLEDNRGPHELTWRILACALSCVTNAPARMPLPPKRLAYRYGAVPSLGRSWHTERLPLLFGPFQSKVTMIPAVGEVDHLADA